MKPYSSAAEGCANLSSLQSLRAALEAEGYETEDGPEAPQPPLPSYFILLGVVEDWIVEDAPGGYIQIKTPDCVILQKVPDDAQMISRLLAWLKSLGDRSYTFINAKVHRC